MYSVCKLTFGHPSNPRDQPEKAGEAEPDEKGLPAKSSHKSASDKDGKCGSATLPGLNNRTAKTTTSLREVPR